MEEFAIDAAEQNEMTTATQTIEEQPTVQIPTDEQEMIAQPAPTKKERKQAVIKENILLTKELVKQVAAALDIENEDEAIEQLRALNRGLREYLRPIKKAKLWLKGYEAATEIGK